MTIEQLDPQEPDFSVLYRRIERIKTDELFQEPYDPPEYLDNEFSN